MKSIIRRYIPRSITERIRRVYYYPLDAFDSVFKNRDELIPPRGLSRYVGKGDFREVGQKYLEYVIELADLKRTDRVLEVGCGIGRMAVALTRHLGEEAIYEGFDIVPQGIKWCRENVTPRYPNFRFQLVDIYNKQYNPKGKRASSDLRFPYQDEFFDFVFLGSVFTHMLSRDVDHYLSEISRVLKIGGKSFITYFLLNDESLELIERKSSTLDFRFELDGCRTIDSNIPERAVAYDEANIRTLYGSKNLNIVAPIHYGSWCGRSTYLDYQDIIVAAKGS